MIVPSDTILMLLRLLNKENRGKDLKYPPVGLAFYENGLGDYSNEECHFPYFWINPPNDGVAVLHN